MSSTLCGWTSLCVDLVAGRLRQSHKRLDFEYHSCRLPELILRDPCTAYGYNGYIHPYPSVGNTLFLGNLCLCRSICLIGTAYHCKYSAGTVPIPETKLDHICSHDIKQPIFYIVVHKAIEIAGFPCATSLTHSSLIGRLAFLSRFSRI